MNKKIYLKDLADWNKNASFYEIEAASPYKKILQQEMIEYFTVKRKAKILDLGAGVGDFAAELESKLNCQVVCADFAKEMKKIALKNYPNLKYNTASAHKLPYKDNSFDMVIATGILHHLKIQGVLPAGLNEIKRVLKKNGTFCYLDRSNSPIADMFELALSTVKNIFNKLKNRYSASSTSSETSLDDNDFSLITSKFKSVSRKSIYSMPFKLLMVISNTLLYVFGKKVYYGFQIITYPIAYISEKYLNFKFWETEYYQVLKSE
jgi:ubiquinone/menaquinone biosynthesis C-methylase UbiE